MLFVGFTNLRRSLVLLDVIVLLSQGQTTLADAQDILRSIHFVSADISREKLHLAIRHHLQLSSKELVFGLCSLHFLDERHDWRQTVLFTTSRIHRQLVEVAEFLFNASFGIAVLQQLLQDAIDTFVVVLGQTVEAAITRIGSRQRIGLHPATAGILEEIVGRTHAGIQVVEVDT